LWQTKNIPITKIQFDRGKMSGSSLSISIAREEEDPVGQVEDQI
jgi:hypothetical protein